MVRLSMVRARIKKPVTGIIVILALAACGSSGGGGGITFSPATVNCANPGSVGAETVTILLPSSVHTGDVLTENLDGKTLQTGPLASDAVPKPDGSWSETLQTNAADMDSFCLIAGNGFTSGTHTEQVLDASGKVLAQGSYTVTH